MDECTLVTHERHDAGVGGSLFQGAANVSITGGIFNAYGAGVTDDKKRLTDAMRLLSSRAEQGAPYDAAAREDVPKCHEHTRVAIIEGIQKWAHSQEPDARPLMWIYGPAGSGKTTIMQTVAEIFDREKHLAASFFFSRLSTARPRKKDNFVVTLAHQLALCIPALQEPLADALSDPSILDKSLSKQVDVLITGPLKTLPPNQIGHRFIFMVDGLDECEGDNAQRDVLNHLESCFRQSCHRIRILIAGRCLSHIQAFFSQSNIGQITQTMPLDNDYQSNEDITSYVLSEFEKIRHEHPSRLDLPCDWPPQPAVGLLVKRASGQFIYASVVMKFIANHGRHPDESLQTITHLKVGVNARPYEELDAVYAQVLSTVEPENVDFITTFLGCMLLDKQAFSFAGVVQTKSNADIDMYFNVRAGTTAARINKMSPLITKYTPAPDDEEWAEWTQTTGLVFSHASFPEYLLDHSRSKEFFIDMDNIHRRLAHQCLESYALKRCNAYSGIKGIPGGPLLRDVIRHCLAIEWTSELQHAILTFDIEMALTASPTQVENGQTDIDWSDMVEWLVFIFWAEYNDRISPADADRIRGRMRNLVRSVCLELSTSRSVDMRVAGILLTCHEIMDIHDCLYYMAEFLSDYERVALSALRGQDHLSFVDSRIHIASHIWFCETLVADADMDGFFFADGSLYADLALRYARCVHARTAFLRPQCTHSLIVMLSKAAPSEELTAFLVQNFIQVPCSRLKDDTKHEFFTALFIYLYESGVPFIAEHQHRHSFDSYSWVCGICVLFDPFKAEIADIELSRDPTGTSCSRFTRATQGNEFALVNPVQPRIPGVPLLWLQAWILWLANSMTRLIPVAM